jgi:hypothetical protein
LKIILLDDPTFIIVTECALLSRAGRFLKVTDKIAAQAGLRIHYC